MRRHRSKIFYKIILPLLAAGAAFVSSKLAFSPAAVREYRVVKVIDGDTVKLNTGERLRYIGIDTPETHRKTKRGWVKAIEPFGREAVRLNESLVLGKTVRLEDDIVKKDKYGRRLAYCFVLQDGREVFVAEELLRQGLAMLYTFPPNVKYVDRLIRAWDLAKVEKRGLWAIDLEVPSVDAGNFIGQRKMVVGRIAQCKTTSKTILLFMEGLHVAIFKKDLDVFLNAGIRPQDTYLNKDVRVFGLIKMYEGSLEIIVSHPSQIEIF